MKTIIQNRFNEEDESTPYMGSEACSKEWFTAREQI